ncbi:hypothetical protein BDF20DRAFT_843066, partial [Mycotypha africana]|uniref:uncharacterized protein n=1 Tax=Mycotypha africana TaxID=64632 RepID=UPI0022FFEBE7
MSINNTAGDMKAAGEVDKKNSAAAPGASTGEGGSTQEVVMEEGLDAMSIAEEVTERVTPLSGHEHQGVMMDEASWVLTTIDDFRQELVRDMSDLSQTRVKGDMEAFDAAMLKMDKTRRAIRSLEENLAFLRKKNSLSSDVFKRYPNEEVFESVDHYLRTFEQIIRSSSIGSVERHWSTLIPLCLPPGDSSWVDKTLVKCASWSDAKVEFRRYYGSRTAKRRFVEQVYTMNMGLNDSIVDYSRKFLQTMHEAGISSTDEGVADPFLTSLTPPVQTVLRLSMVTNKDKKWTVEKLSELARDILGDDPSTYALATALLPGTSFAANNGSVAIPSGGGERPAKKMKKIHKGGSFPSGDSAGPKSFF